MKWNMTNDLVRHRTVRKLVIGALHNLDFLLSLYLFVYLIDFVLNSERDADQMILKNGKLLNLIVVGTCRIFTKLLLHICDFLYTSYDMQELSAQVLHAALCERYLNYDESARKEINPAFISMGMMSDVPALVGGYCTVIQAIQEMGKLLAMLIYQFSIPPILGRPFMRESMSITFVFPICSALFFYLRNGYTSHLLDMANKKFHSLAHQVHETVRCYRLIADFKKRSLFITRIREASQDNNNTRKEATFVVLNNNYYALWLGRLAVGFYTLFGGIKVIAGLLPIGLYLTNVGIFEDYAKVWATMYEILLAVQDCFPSLEHVMVLLNMPDDLVLRKDVISHNLHGTCAGISGHRNTMQASQSMPLTFEDIKVHAKIAGVVS